MEGRKERCYLLAIHLMGIYLELHIPWGRRSSLFIHSSACIHTLEHSINALCINGWMSFLFNSLSLKAGGEGDDRGWDGWIPSLTRWTRVWTSSRSWWWTGKPGVIQSMGSQRVGHDWVTELNWFKMSYWFQVYNIVGFPGGSVVRIRLQLQDRKEIWVWSLGWKDALE